MKASSSLQQERCTRSVETDLSRHRYRDNSLVYSQRTYGDFAIERCC